MQHGKPDEGLSDMAGLVDAVEAIPGALRSFAGSDRTPAINVQPAKVAPPPINVNVPPASVTINEKEWPTYKFTIHRDKNGVAEYIIGEPVNG